MFFLSSLIIVIFFCPYLLLPTSNVLVIVTFFLVSICTDTWYIKFPLFYLVINRNINCLNFYTTSWFIIFSKIPLIIVIYYFFDSNFTISLNIFNIFFPQIIIFILFCLYSTTSKNIIFNKFLLPS